MYRVKQLLGASLSLQITTHKWVRPTPIRALNKLTGIGMPETPYVVQNANDLASVRSFAEFGNKISYILSSQRWVSTAFVSSEEFLCFVQHS